MIPVFGFEYALSQLLGVSSTPQGLQALVDDWIHPEYDESATLGLLDIFSSLILQNVGDHSRTALLLHHSRGLVESIQQHNTQHMKTRPFIQFILARAAIEIEQAWKERDVQGLSEPDDGLLVSPGAGVNLPIFVPAKHLEKPGWERFSAQTPSSLWQAVNIALQAAKFTGDYALQATAWKLLILQSQEPKPMMEGLAHLQLHLQDDKEGFLTTCLSKYLTTLDRGEGKDLLKELDHLDKASDGTYLSWGFNASLLWARSIIQGHLESSTQGPTDEISGAMQDPGSVCRDEIYAYGARLSDRVVRFLDSAFNITAPRPLRVSFNGILNCAQGQAAKLADPQQEESHSPHLGSLGGVDDSSKEEKKELQDTDTIANVMLDDRIRSARDTQQPASPPPVTRPPQRLEDSFKVARPQRYPRTVGITDVNPDSSDDADVGPQHRTADPEGDSDVDIRVRRQYSEAKNVRHTVREVSDWPDSAESSSKDQYSSDSEDWYVEKARRELDNNCRLNPRKVSFRPITNYFRAKSPPRYSGSRKLERDRDRERKRSREREREREPTREREEAFTRNNPLPYPSTFQGGYPTHMEGFPGSVGTFAPHPWAPSTHPGMLPPHFGSLPLTPGGVPPPSVYPPGMYYGLPLPPQQPGYFPVSGWPATWQQDANHLLSPADPRTQSYYGQPPPPLLLEGDAHRVQGAYPPQRIVSSADGGFRHDRGETHHFVPLPPLAEERDSTVGAVASKAAEVDGKKDSTTKAVGNEDVEGEESDEVGEELPRASVQDGLPKLDFPPEILDDNTMTVLVRSKADPQKGKIYTISKEGVTESDVIRVAGHSHQDTGNPHHSAGHPYHESSGIRKHSPTIRRRTSYRDTSLPRHDPVTHGPVRAVPDAPPPPRTDSFAAKAKEPIVDWEAESAKNSTDKQSTTEPEARQHKRQNSTTKTDASKNSAKPAPPDRNTTSGPFVASPRRMPTKDRHITTSPSRAGTKDQHVPRAKEQPLADKPAPEQGTKNKNQAYAETDGESDARPGSPVESPPDKKDEGDKLSVTAQRGGNKRGEADKGIARAQTWNM